jgi:hypothetical protein
MSTNSRGGLPCLFPDKEISSPEESESEQSVLLPLAETDQASDSASSFADRVWATVSKRALIGPPPQGEAKS